MTREKPYVSLHSGSGQRVRGGRRCEEDLALDLGARSRWGWSRVEGIGVGCQLVEGGYFEREIANLWENRIEYGKSYLFS